MAQRIKGTDRSEKLLGDVTTDYIWGNGGHDRIDGFSKKDFLYGGEGNDLILGGDDKDKLYGGNGIDRLYGGYGDDWILADDKAGTQHGDQIYGGDGNDFINAGGGNDYVNGEDQWDLITYCNANRGISVDLETSRDANGNITGTARAGKYGTDKLVNVESVIGSIYADVIVGSSVGNVIGWEKTSPRGDYFLIDVTKGLDGSDGNDRISGLEGDDILIGGAGADILSGGDGIDGATYFRSKIGVTVSLVTNRGVGGEAQGDVLRGIEDLHGSSRADKLYGNTGDNWLNGNGGDDKLYDGEGNDRVEGDAGNDSLYAGVDGEDIYDGGNGFDTLYLASLGSGGEGVIVAVTVPGFDDPRPWLSGGGGMVANSTNADFVRGIEKFVGTAWNDEFYGDAKDNSFAGGEGDDIFKGSKGADIYAGGNGADTFVFEDAYIGPVSGTTNIDTILDYQAGDFLDFADLMIKGTILGDPSTDFATKRVTSGTMLYLNDGVDEPDIVLFSKNYTITIDDLIADGAFLF